MVLLRVQKTVLIYCEGKHEQAFVQHLRSIYDSRDSGVRITVKRGRGGSVPNIVEAAGRCFGAFDKRVIKLDHDKNETEIESAKRLARNKGIELYFSKPCLELTLLEILEPGTNFSALDSSQLKSKFESEYIKSRHRGDATRFKTLLTKEVLEQARSSNAMLDQLIRLITDG
jgi:hypothetical protein